MTYSESAKGLIISKGRAVRELLNHGITEIDMFFKENGERDFYLASDVLKWLGY